MIGRTLDDLIEALEDIRDEYPGSGSEIVRVNDENGTIGGHVTGLDLMPKDGGGIVTWISFEETP